MMHVRRVLPVVVMSLFGLLSLGWSAQAPKKAAVAPEASVIAALPADPLTLDLRDADLKSFLRALGKEFRLNLLVHDDVKGQLTISLEKVPFRDFIEGVTRAHGLVVVPAPGGIIEILPASIYQARLKALAAAVPAAPPPSLITQKIQVQHAFNPRDSISGAGRDANISGRQVKDLTELVDVLKKRLSGRPGSDITMVSRLNSVIITDIPQKVEEIAGLIKALDVATKTVGIEARIAEVGTQALEDLGVQWGGRIRFGDAAFTGGAARATTTGTAPTAPQTGAVGLSGTNFLVNLPASIPIAGPGGSLGFTLGRAASRILDVQLSALEQEGKAKLLAAPRLTTRDHERAWIESGQEIPFRNISVTATGVSTFTIQFKQASIELEVTPHVIEGGPSRSVLLDILVTRKEADFGRAIEGNPPLLTRTIYTRAVVQEGETAVIGGLMREDATDREDAIPLLSDIPVFGWLFKRVEKKDDRSQLMIFLTPSVLPASLTTAATAPPTAEPSKP